MKELKYQDTYQLNRRQFISGLSAAGITAAITSGGLLRADETKQKIKLGIIGCGGRGKFIGDLALEHGGYEIVSLADYFQNQVDKLGSDFHVPAARRFTGLNCYKRMLDAGGIDAVAIVGPPYFHPEQTEAAVDAKVHIFLAKPIAIDSPGVVSIEESGKKATTKKLCLLIDFQTRAYPHFQEAAKRIAAGYIGKLALGEIEATCPDFKLKVPADNKEAVLRNWMQYKELTGEFIVEFSIHAIDIANLMIGRPPVKAIGFGGRRCLDRPVGNCWDTFLVNYIYDNDLNVALRAKRFDRYGTPNTGWLYMTLYGSEGCLESGYSGTVNIRGKKYFFGNKFLGKKIDDIYKGGALRNLGTFYDNIKNGKYENPTVALSAQSHYLALLGREAGYRNGEYVTWDEIINSKERIEFDKSGLKI